MCVKLKVKILKKNFYFMYKTNIIHTYIQQQQNELKKKCLHFITSYILLLPFYVNLPSYKSVGLLYYNNIIK